MHVLGGVCTETPRGERAWSDSGSARRPVWLEQREQGNTGGECEGQIAEPCCFKDNVAITQELLKTQKLSPPPCPKLLSENPP